MKPAETAFSSPCCDHVPSGAHNVDGVPLEQRCHTAFAEHAGGELLSAGSFDAAFRRAGFPDAHTEQVERYYQNFVLQRQGVAGSCLRLDEFVRILAAHDQKRRQFLHLSISSMGEEY